MTILDEILARKRDEVAAARRRVPESALQQCCEGLGPPRDFTAALTKPGLQVLAEIKRASPSAGVIRPDFDPVTIARAYSNNGAAALSVLTDKHYFQGHLEFLTTVHTAVSIPVLRKDFIIDRYQLLEARAAGADAVLLIAEALPSSQLAQLNADAHALGLHVLIELHEADQLDRVLDLNPTLLGINNRNLKTFETRLEHTLELLPRIPSHIAVVSESGIRTHSDFRRLGSAGVAAVLVGESLMRQPDIGMALRTLRGVA